MSQKSESERPSASVDAKRRVPDYLEPLIGWRVWLRELQRGDSGMGLWSADEIEAECDPHGLGGQHESCLTTPGESCASAYGYGCGLYAFKRAEDLEATHYGTEPADYIYGRVALWGKVIEHERGWRAQKGKLLSLSDRAEAERLGVEYETTRATIACQWPPPSLFYSSFLTTHIATIQLWSFPPSVLPPQDLSNVVRPRVAAMGRLFKLGDIYMPMSCAITMLGDDDPTQICTPDYGAATNPIVRPLRLYFSEEERQDGKDREADSYLGGGAVDAGAAFAAGLRTGSVPSAALRAAVAAGKGASQREEDILWQPQHSIKLNSAPRGASSTRTGVGCLPRGSVVTGHTTSVGV